MKIFIILIFFPILSYGQIIEGKVKDNVKNSLPGAIVYFKNKYNQAVVTDNEGKFKIVKEPIDNILITRLMGFKNDTLEVNNQTFVEIKLADESSTLQAVVIKSNATVIDRLSSIHTEIITSKTLAKAACCNLSESFETNASVSVSYSDAVTGAKQIQLLGLAGTYVQTNIENIPNIRGLATTFGLNYVPGTWIQSIDIAKGVGSVVNGYENMGGALNVELKKPELAERLLLNVFVNNWGRGEVNLNLAKKLNSKWAVGLLSHGSILTNETDNNKDGFLDQPTYNQINLLNRWKYASDKYMVQFGVKFLNENRQGGQLGFKNTTATPDIYGFTNNTKRTEFFSKTARLFNDAPYRGLGLIINAVNHNSDSKFGFKPYLATQNTFYSNLIYQDKIGNTNHTYKTGLSFLADSYDEKLGGLFLKRSEAVPGAFLEYTFNHLDRTTLLLGIRNDFHNLFGNQFTPRVHFKQDIGQNDTWRFSIGKGFRVPTPLAENYGNLVSNRSVKFLDKIQPEVSWTLGTSYVKNINKLTLSAEYYYTYFKNQWIVDLEHPQLIYFYALEGKSFTSSGLIELNYGPVKNWELKLAYRYVESKQTMGKPFDEKVVLDKMFLSKNRVLFNVAYALPYNKWKVDATLQWNGKRRLPNIDKDYKHVSYYAMPINFSPSFVNVNAQVTRNFVKFEWYLGAENLTGFRQKDPIIDSKEPFGNYFDAGMAWGPVVGATVYSGFRYKIL